MEILKFDLTKKLGSFKALNATNGGPWHKRNASAMIRSNFKAYKEARIPYFRNHDSGLLSIYGGPYAHDISKIFRNFDADETEPTVKIIFLSISAFKTFSSLYGVRRSISQSMPLSLNFIASS